ncbi:GHKL domain-containing protein [Holdemania massiliensis]|uniref:GHKL domain-containing protein n=2 Tax=Holdemania massiliensis TaxID=1468449 RepID=A0A6N7S9Y8_9FIRM|nr:GHKL domain-containing protein [Holdemania massiliensis]MSA90096.1 GHKL domain-containing protein [Holdemania massiliensis]MSB78902.1 GHKL domain-containing protein [Holdemania massiliensis]MSC33826.1 GHKL domain-containing protein [Holdemania massiliensis]MSC40216.1 GHKL domain-containing protein [Holdemania massiliensis]
MIECLPGIALIVLLWLRFQRKSLILDLAVLIGGALSYGLTRSFLPFFILTYLLCLILEQQRSQSRPLILAVMGVSMIFFVSYGVQSGQLLLFLGLSLLLYGVGCANQRFLRRSYEERMMEYQNKILVQQMEEVNNIYQIMRGWRHDYHNHLQNLKAQLRMNQIPEAQAYLNELEQDLDDIYELVDSGNLNVDAILNSKLSMALKKDIALDYKATVPPKLKVTDLDLCVILGNLIDNAMEACETVESGRFIRLYIGVFKQQLYISLSNATSEVVRKLDKEYITHKRGNHGHGLKRINLEVEKYGGYINRKNEPGIFVTEIMLPL